MSSSLAVEKTGSVRKRRSPPKPVLEPGRVAPRNKRLAAAVAADGRAIYVIGAAAGWAPTTLSQAVHGWKIPSPERCARLAAVLGYSVEELFGSEDLIIPA
jgi:hypothetical protein